MNSSSIHAFKITSNDSQYLSRASSIDMPKVWYSFGEKPLPIAKFSRPPQRLSASPYSSATISGWWNGRGRDGCRQKRRFRTSYSHAPSIRLFSLETISTYPKIGKISIDGYWFPRYFGRDRRDRRNGR